MKLHLPKSLLIAVLAVVATTQTVWGMSISPVELRLGSEAFENVTACRNGVVYTFSYDGNGTISGLNMDSQVLTYKFDIDLDKAASASNVTDKNSTDTSYLIYVSNGSTQWGLRLYDGSYAENNVEYSKDGVPEIVGHWSDEDLMYNQDVNAATLAELGYVANGGDSQSATVTAILSDINPNGVSLSVGTTQVYHQNNLLTTTDTMTTVVFNTEYISNFVIADSYSQVQVSNSKGTWSKVFDFDKVTNVTTGRTQLESGHTNVNPIVVGGTGQLFLQSWKEGGNPNALNVSSDIYLGSTSYTEANSGAAYNNVALRFGNDATDADGNITNVTGNIYVVEDAMMKSGSTNAINISGTVTDTVDGVDTNSTLTVSGKGYNFTGAINLSGMVIETGADIIINSTSVSIDSLTNKGALALSGSNVTIASSISNEAGSITTNDSTVFNVKDISALNNRQSDYYGIEENGVFQLNRDYVVIDGGKVSGTGSVSYTVNNKQFTTTLTDGGYFTHVYTAYGVVQNATLADIAAGVKDGGGDIIAIKSGVTLSKGTGATPTTAQKLTGAGKYDLGTVLSGSTMSSSLLGNNIKLDTEWTGTVSISGGEVKNNGGNNDNQIKGIDFNALGHASSTVEITSGGGGLYGYLGSSTTYLPNIKLTGSLYIQDGGSGYNHTFAGDFSGNGSIYLRRTGGGANTYTFSGNLTGWQGSLITQDNNGSSSDHQNNVTITGKATTVKAIIDRQSGILNLTVDNSGETTTFNKNVTVSDLIITNGSKVAMATDTVLDLTGKFADMSGQDNKLNNLLTTLQSVTTAGTSYVLVNGTQGTTDYSMQHDMTIADNMVLDGHLTLNGRGWDSGHSNGHKLLVSDASLKVGKDGAGSLTLATKATLEIASGNFEAGAATLGYIGTGSGGNYGAINITGGSVKLQSVNFGGAWEGNAVTMTAGNLEFTGEGAVFTGNNDNAKGSVSISGGEVVVNKDQRMNTVANKRSVSLSNMSFNIAENKSMALDTGVTVSGDVTVKGKGTLKFAGANNLSALSGTVKVTEAAKLQYMSDAVSVAAKGATGAAVSASAIQDAVVTVGGTADVSISQILSDSSLAYNGTSNLGIAGDGHTLTGVAAGNGSISFSGNAGIVNSEGSDLASMSNVTISKLDIATAADKTIQVSGNSSTAAGQMSGLLALEEGASLKLSNVTMSESSMVQGYSAPMAVMAVDAGGNIAAAGNSVTLENTTVKLGATVPAVVQATAGNVIAPSVPTEIGASAKVYTFTSDIFNGVALDATGENALNVELSSVLTDALYGKGYDYVALSFENSTIVSGRENGINVTFEDEALTHLNPSVFLADNTIYIAIDQIPEPTTATLSLLALAALAARRRRK